MFIPFSPYRQNWSENTKHVGGESTADVVVSCASRLLIHPNYNRDTFVSISNADNASLDSYKDK